MDDTNDERRRAPRTPVAVYLHQHVGGDSHRCFTTDLSATGLYMERPVTSFSRSSTSVQLEIPLPEGEPVWAGAEIVYDCFDGLFHGTAVRFTAMANEDRDRLEQWMESQAELPAAALTA